MYRMKQTAGNSCKLTQTSSTLLLSVWLAVPRKFVTVMNKWRRQNEMMTPKKNPEITLVVELPSGERRGSGYILSV